ncbi:hypothetical protein X927_09250 [Petrotoga mexicana DSM 14811]|uniref:Uncharacterized protein n=1 Tax=Petrotoga mexicana DSM 14811 TaxID=1122954 RepID=A0A2K1P6S9_9BACT|nr:hypothetical protein [Petrotoga mexicana]PNR98427.1 hypothetical protein X927_09250 [Petrotoga mexicana DSM 14811]
MIKLKYKGKKVCINHIDCFIKPFENEFQLRKIYFQEITDKKITFKKIHSSDKEYFLVVDASDYKKSKRSLFFDSIIPVQSILLKKVLEFKEGRYVLGTDFYNYEFIRNTEFAFSGLIVDEKPTYFFDNQELKELAIKYLEDKRIVPVRI